jgi:hypothetical protein
VSESEAGNWPYVTHVAKERSAERDACECDGWRQHQGTSHCRPITVHVLSGDLKFVTPTGAQDLESVDLLSLAAGIRHSVESNGGAQFLITIALPSAGNE